MLVKSITQKVDPNSKKREMNHSKTYNSNLAPINDNGDTYPFDCMVFQVVSW
jgi:hypothetical protein